MTADRGPRLSTSWLVALVASVGMLAAVLIFTRDLRVTTTSLRTTVHGVDELVVTTGRALDSTEALPPATAALDRGMPEVEAMAASLERSVAAVAQMSADLDRLNRALPNGDRSLGQVLEAVQGASGTAGEAEAAVRRMAGRLRAARDLLRGLGPLLDETVSRTTRIERKLRLFQPLRSLLFARSDADSACPQLGALCRPVTTPAGGVR